MQRTLVLLHPFPFEGGFWQPQVEAMSDRYRVLAPDLRGFGIDRRTLPAAMTMERHAADVRDLLDSEGIESAVLCGMSMGGYVAMAFAQQWPERTDALILCNTRASADDAAGFVAREKTALDALEHGAAVIARAMLPKLLSERTRQHEPQLLQRIEAMIARQRPNAIAASSRGMALRPDRHAFLRTWTKPAFVITGSDDELMPLPTSEAMRDALPNGRMLVLPGAAHLSSVEQPSAFNEALIDFLGSLH